MERPRRSAAERALELITKGIAARILEENDDKCLSEDEEDRLDEELTGNVDENEDLSDESDDERIGHPSADRRTSKTYPSYGCPDIEVTTPLFTPQRPVGLQIGPSMNTRSDVRAIDMFRLFFTDEILENISSNTNTYAYLNVLNKQTYAKQGDGSWDATSIKELQYFLGLIIYMGFVNLPEIHKYWSTAVLYHGTWARRFMSRNRFKALLAFLHVADPDAEDQQDKLTKLQPLLSHIKSKCGELFQPDQCIAIDERMVKSKGRSGIRQYMPAKPVRFGYKLWCLADSQTGYTLDFNVYTGKRENPGPHGLAYDVVLRLMGGYTNQGYSLFVDNFYTSVPLANYMTAHRVGFCGTINPNRRGFPPELKSKEWSKQARRGDMRYQRKEHLLFTQWMDSKVVNMCSTIHKGNEFQMVKRNLRDPAGKHRAVMVKKPVSIIDYNKQMGAVDLSDQLLQAYSVLLKSHRWWKTLFFHIVDIAVVNSHIMYKMWYKKHGDETDRRANVSQLTFREQLVQQLAGIADNEEVPLAATSRKTSEFSVYHTMHVPMHTDRRQNCRLCYALEGKERRSRWICAHEQCNMAFCMSAERNCFADWHSVEFDVMRVLVLQSMRHVQ